MTDIDSKERVRILLVEDDLTNQLVTKTRLEKNGFAVDCALNGFEACEIAKTIDYSLILMDISMPMMDGFTAAARIREQSSRNNDIPIIAMTAHNLDEVRDQREAAGMNDSLSKPVAGDVLIAAIERWLAR